MVKRDEVRDVDLSIRFKHGNHTILLFVDATAPLSHIQDELLGILKERYSGGISSSATAPEKTPLPDTASQIKFAMLENKTDPASGWKPLAFERDDAPVDKGFQDNMMVAFTFAAEDVDDADDLEFEVEFPSYEEEEEEAEDMADS